MLAEYDLTKRLVLAVTGHDRLLADRQVLSGAVALRDPASTRSPTCSSGRCLRCAGCPGHTRMTSASAWSGCAPLSVNGVAACG